MNDDLKAKIILEWIDLKTGYTRDIEDDVLIDAIKLGLNQISVDELCLHLKNEEIKRGLIK